MRTTCCIALLSAFLASPVFAADPAKPLGKSGDWESFTYAEKGGKVCYMRSLPKKSTGAPKKRGAAFFTITHRTTDKSIGVVSVDAGFAFKKDSQPLLEVGTTKFDLYVSDETAWSRNDKAVVAAMLKGKAVSVKQMPAKGDAVTDVYSLNGFAKAYKDIGTACGL